MADIQKYNQRLLAIIGTLALGALVIAILASLAEVIGDLFPSQNNNNDSGIVVDQNQIIDTTSFSFNQNISILEPYMPDSTKPLFIVPIGQKDQTTKKMEMITSGFRFSSDEIEDFHYSSFDGLFNNFILVDYERDIKMPVFKTKIAITEWAFMKIDDSQLILFKGTNKDSNKDGLLNDNDFQSLFILNIQSLQTKELHYKNETVLSFEPLNRTSKIYVRTGKDFNQDKAFEYNKEPTDLYFYDVSTGESETLIPANIKEEIQKVLSK